MSNQKDVTAVLADVDSAAALRDRIKVLESQLKIHTDAIADVLGEATEGIDDKGNIVVRRPWRNRSDLDRKKVKSLLSDEDYAQCVRETSYRVFLFG
jgi:hypothetical protein